MKQAGDVTGLLQAWMRGDPDALAELASLVHYELRQMAKRMLAGERAAYAWQPTDLINESYLRLLGWRDVEWKNRAHFFGASTSPRDSSPQTPRGSFTAISSPRTFFSHGRAWPRSSISGSRNLHREPYGATAARRRSPEGRLFAVSVRPGPNAGLSFGPATKLNVPPLGERHENTIYDVSLDGRIVYFQHQTDQHPPSEFGIVLGWRALIK